MKSQLQPLAFTNTKRDLGRNFFLLRLNFPNPKIRTLFSLKLNFEDEKDAPDLPTIKQ